MIYTPEHRHGDKCVNSPVLTSPEVFDELPERLCPLGQRYDDVDEDAAHVHALALNLHHGTERPEEHELREAPRAVFSKHQLIYSPPVPLCARQPWDRHTRGSRLSLQPVAYKTNRPQSFFLSPSTKSEGEYECFLLTLFLCCSGPFRMCRAVSTAPISSALRSLLTGLSSGCLLSPVSSWYTLSDRRRSL